MLISLVLLSSRRAPPVSKYQYQLDRVMAGKVTPMGLALLRRMLEYDPEKRIKADEALDHEYFKEAPSFTNKYWSYFVCGKNRFAHPDHENVIRMCRFLARSVRSRRLVAFGPIPSGS